MPPAQWTHRWALPLVGGVASGLWYTALGVTALYWLALIADRRVQAPATRWVVPVLWLVFWCVRW